MTTDTRDYSLNIKGRLYHFDRPKVMGIINATPDSFYSASRARTADDIRRRAAELLADGADMLDIGGYSSRPGADDVSAEEEYRRLATALEAVRSDFPDAIVSVDTFRAEVARKCVVNYEADIINDISGGDLDPAMWETVADLKVPYVLMHMRGNPRDMQTLTDYSDVTADVMRDLAFKAAALHDAGVADIIIDPGFGFAKTVDQNYRLLGHLDALKELGMPLLAGLSRKSMIWRELGVTAAEAADGTTALGMVALMKGADILRVHDAKAAAQSVALAEALRRNA